MDKSFEIVRYLVAKSADVNAKGLLGNTLLSNLCSSLCSSDNKQNRQTYFDIVKLLIENGADINCGDNLPPLAKLLFGYSSKKHDESYFKVAKLLIENGADVNYSIKGVTILGNICAHIAIHDKSDEEKQIHFKVAKLLI